MTYWVWEGFFEELEKKMARVGRKCAKYGVDFVFRLTGNEEFRDEKDDKGEIHKLRYVEVEAAGKAEINGWKWLASVERTENGNLIHSATDVTIPTKYYTSDCYCEHCGRNVWRTHLFLVKNTKTGEIKQVGRNCLCDYTHGMSAEGIARYMSALDALEEAANEKPYSGGGWGFNTDYYDVEEVTRFACETIRLFGFVPRSDDSKIPTAERVQDFYDVAHGRRSAFFPAYERFDEIADEMKKVGFNADSPAAAKEAREALEWLDAQDDSRSAYLHNLKVVVAMKEVKRRHFGILASLIPTWNKDLVREAERKAREMAEKKSEHVGKIGERISFDVASTRIVTSWETEYGTMWMIKFVSKEGNVFMWRSSAIHALPDDLELIGKVVGTVKDHDEFRGVKQTVINRCKITELDKKAPEVHPEYNDDTEKAINAFFDWCAG